MIQHTVQQAYLANIKLFVMNWHVHVVDMINVPVNMVKWSDFHFLPVLYKHIVNIYNEIMFLTKQIAYGYP